MAERIFLTGATGFVGSHFLRALLAAGYRVRACCRSPERQEPHAQIEWIAGDFSTDHDPAIWTERLRDCSTVINAVGIITETRSARFEDLHTRGPVALFKAAKDLNIDHVIQISALGADENGTTAYHRTKYAADQELQRLIPGSTVLRPSLILGPGGKSMNLFTVLSSLPVIPLPGRGDFAVQPIRIDDLTAGVIQLLRAPFPGVLDVTGPQALTWKGMLAGMARSRDLRPLFMPIPLFLIRLVARLGIGPLSLDTLAMLERGSTADPEPFQKKAGIQLQDATDLPAMGIHPMEMILPVFWPVMRISLAFLWIWTGIVSLFLFPVEQSFAWLKATLIPEALLYPALVSASMLDALLGLLLFTRLRTLAYGIQFVTVLVYTIILTFALPEMWLHPFGPASKNLPLLALTLLGWILDRKRNVPAS
ncbi:MAG: NAD(P)H-binding protein [Spirochaetales bacterium]|nr:NAD(P)H-binding protein [Spirochaetales bacterium]